MHGFSLSDAFTLSCLQCDWGHSNDWTLISSPSIWVYVGVLQSSWKRLQHTHTYMNTSCLHPANTHIYTQILSLVSSVLGFSFPLWFHFILLFFLSCVCLYVEKLLGWPDDRDRKLLCFICGETRVQIHPTLKVHVFVLIHNHLGGKIQWKANVLLAWSHYKMFFKMTGNVKHLPD